MKQRELIIRFAIDMEKYNSSLKHADTTLRDFAHRATGSTTGGGKGGIFGKIGENFSGMLTNRMGSNPLGGVVSSITSGLGMIGVTTAGVAVAAGLMWGAFSAGKSTEVELTRLKTIVGSAGAAKQIYKDMTKLASETPMEMTQIMPAATQLVAIGMRADQLTDKMRMIGDVASGSGKNFNELTNIMAKNFSTGLVQGEDLNQLSEARIPILKVLGDMYGKTGEQIRDMASKGKLHYADLEKAFERMTQKGGIYFNAMKSQSLTVDGLLSTLRDSFHSIFVAMSGVLAPEGATTMWTYIGQIMANVGKGFGDFVNKISPFLTDLGTAFGGIFKLISNITSVLITILTPTFYYVGLIVWGIVKALNVVLWVSDKIYGVMFRVGNSIVGWLDRTFKITDTIKLVINQISAMWAISMIYLDIMIQKIENWFTKGGKVRNWFAEMLGMKGNEHPESVDNQVAIPITPRQVQQQQANEEKKKETLRNNNPAAYEKKYGNIDNSRQNKTENNVYVFHASKQDTAHVATKLTGMPDIVPQQ